MYKGMLCSMAAFKKHCTFGFWKGSLIVGKTQTKGEEAGMGQFGRITSLLDLPSGETFIGYVKKAMELNEAGVKVLAKPKPKGKNKFTIPCYFAIPTRFLFMEDTSHILT